MAPVMSPGSCPSTSGASTEEQRRSQQKNALFVGANVPHSKAVTVMSYEIWKEQCAAQKKATMQNKAVTCAEPQRQRRKRSSDDQVGTATQKRSTTCCSSPRALSRPGSSSTMGRLSVASTSSDSRQLFDECRCVTLPTIPPMTVMVRPDGSPVSSTVAPLPLSSNSLPALNPTSNPRLEMSFPNAFSLPLSNPGIPNPIAVNHIPSKDVRIMTGASLAAKHGLSTTVRPSPSVMSSLVQRQIQGDASIPARHGLTLPIRSAPAVPSAPQMNFSPTVTHTTQSVSQSGALGHPPLSQSSLDLLATLLQGTLPSEYAMSTSPLLSTSATALLAQQHQQQQLHLFPGNGIGEVFATHLQQPNSVLGCLASSASPAVLPSVPIGTTSLSLPNVSSAAIDLLRQLQQQHQLRQLAASNSIPASDLLAVYQLLGDSTNNEIFQNPVKQVEPSGAFIGQITGITT